ncbi:hypothetical protein GCM10020258_01340 [Sphingomonas yabuuchiae]
MRMIMADHRRAAIPRGPVRGDQHGGIDLETMARFGRDIGAGDRLRNVIVLPQQQSAHLIIG